MDKEMLKQLIIDLNKNKNLETGIEREKLNEIEKYFKTNHVIIITGPRRAGKSTLLNQFIKITKKPYHYFAFDDERLINFKITDFSLLYELLMELYGDKKLFIFDEIQNIPQWERFVNRMHKQGYKFILTGSNAFLLSKEFSTFLTGRHLDILLLPFSFKEFLKLKKIKISKIITTKEKAIIKKSFLEYIEKGGFPEYLKSNEKEVLKTLYEDMILKDVILRYNIREKNSLRKIAFYLISNIGKPFTFTKLKNNFNIKTTNTVIDFIRYLEETYLFFTINKYSPSLNSQNRAPKKVYCVDNGLINTIAFQFSKNKGRLLENLVFIDLKRQKKEIYYHKEKYKCDFLIKENNKIVQAIQVTYELNEENKEREINGLLEAMNKHNIKKGLILTYDQEDTIKIKNKTINLVPVWKWLLKL